MFIGLCSFLAYFLAERMPGRHILVPAQYTHIEADYR